MRNNALRYWWKPWTWSTRVWLCVISLACIVSPLLTRWICLWRVPDIELPFDVTAVIQDEIPAENDAIGVYLEALRLFDSSETTEPSGGLAFADLNEWQTAVENTFRPERKWDPRLDTWLIGRRKAVAEFQRASRMKLASGPSLKTADFDTGVATHQQLRNLCRLATVESLRLQRGGDLLGAWELLQASLRLSRHCQMPRFDICHFIGSGIHAYTSAAIVRWAESPLVTVEQLALAREEIQQDRRLAVPTSDLLKANYLQIRNMVRNTADPNQLIPNWRLFPNENPLIISIKRLMLWSFGEPELLLRVARHELANSVTQIDLPLAKRQSWRKVTGEIVFNVDPRAHQPKGQISPDRLSKQFEIQMSRMPGLGNVLINAASMDSVNRNYEARRIVMDVLLAAHQYQRQRDEFPDSLERLVPEYLDSIPIDPMDPAGHPIRYQRSSNVDAIVWSVGVNAIDEGGDIQPSNSNDTGYRLMLNSSQKQPGESDNQSSDTAKNTAPGQ